MDVSAGVVPDVDHVQLVRSFCWAKHFISETDDSDTARRLTDLAAIATLSLTMRRIAAAGVMPDR